ncbi:MAG: transaldolase family protein [Spirochaetales bacterium]
MKVWKSALHQMAETTKTQLWNDSCAVSELTESMKHGAVGATTNPVIVGNVLKKELPEWSPRILEFVHAHPLDSEDDIAWRIIEEMGTTAAKLLLPVFRASGGLKGRLSMQTNPKYWRDSQKMVEHALHLASLAPNIQVKIPTTFASLSAFEEVTYRGVSINATVSFTVAQAVAVAEAVERGLARRRRESLDCSAMSPVVTIMVGRVDDWLKKVAEKQGIITDPGYLEWAGVAVFKHAYEIYQQRGYRSKLLSAAYRNHMHWSEFIGGDVVVSIPFDWQQRFVASDVTCESRMANPVNPVAVGELLRKFPDFVKAYEEGALIPAEFDSYAPTRRTLRQFIAAYDEVVSIVRNLMIPDPDLKGQ